MSHWVNRTAAMRHEYIANHYWHYAKKPIRRALHIFWTRCNLH